ncbi:hypothetical protein M6B38_204275 [Iris pallida]|uniref:Uncharacterized protein n=1 Tax=Iris pallida TaxID=29817 RepID=A0AAX6E7M4_IRIPA|nr:hypothetical protein M6B38_204275 [Iris pallida]
MRTTMKLPLFGGDAVLRIRSLDVGSDGYGSGEALERRRRDEFEDTTRRSVGYARSVGGHGQDTAWLGFESDMSMLCDVKCSAMARTRYWM